MNLNNLVEKIDVVEFQIDFEGNEEHWQSYFFELMSLKNTFGGCLKLTIDSTSKGDKVWIILVVKKDKEYMYSRFLSWHYVNVSRSCFKALTIDEMGAIVDCNDVLYLFID